MKRRAAADCSEAWFFSLPEFWRVVHLALGYSRGPPTSYSGQRALVIQVWAVQRPKRDAKEPARSPSGGQNAPKCTDLARKSVPVKPPQSAARKDHRRADGAESPQNKGSCRMRRRKRSAGRDTYGHGREAKKWCELDRTLSPFCPQAFLDRQLYGQLRPFGGHGFGL